MRDTPGCERSAPRPHRTWALLVNYLLMTILTRSGVGQIQAPRQEKARFSGS